VPKDRAQAEEETDTVGETTAVALHNLLDGPDPAPLAGDPLPPLWHWLAFLSRGPQRELGADGHPRRTGPEQERFPRRMFAGGRLVFEAPALIGEPLVRRSRTVSSVEKVGRTGPLLLTTVEHEISQAARVVIREEQDIIYRAEGAGPSGTVAPQGPWPWELDLAADPTMLFRFSALTYNAHRIHYDRDYARQIEGYPGLVVQGPLQALTLAELCRRHARGPLRTFEFRAVFPAFEGDTLRARGRSEADRITLAVFNGAGNATMEAGATVRPGPRQSQRVRG